MLVMVACKKDRPILEASPSIEKKETNVVAIENIDTIKKMEISLGKPKSDTVILTTKNTTAEDKSNNKVTSIKKEKNMTLSTNKIPVKKKSESKEKIEVSTKSKPNESKPKDESNKVVNEPSKGNATPTKTQETTKVEAPKKSEEKIEQKTEQKVEQKIEEPLNYPTYKDYSKVLAEYVSTDGRVNYKALKNNRALLDASIAEMTSLTPKSDWTRNESLAYYINVYNAFTLKKIVDNYPLSSITKLNNGKPWDVKDIKIGSNTYSLNDIENKIIRPQYKDARIHFAVNCAAKSCPKLLNKPYLSNNVNSLLEANTNQFINNKAFNKIEANEIEVSKIFEWYGEDFGTLINYLNKYSKVKIDANAKVKFSEYNWALNE